MKKTILFIFLFFSAFNLSIKAQLIKLNKPNLITSHDIFVSKEGLEYSDHITIKFNQNIVKSPTGKKEIYKDNIDNVKIKQLLNSLEKKYGKISIEKVIPDAFWGDTIKINKRTHKPVTISDYSQLVNLTFSNLIPLDSIISVFKKESYVKYALPPLKGYLTAVPNDPIFIDPNNHYNWGLKIIDAPKAWDITKGNKIISINDYFSGRDTTGWVVNNTIHNDIIDNVLATSGCSDGMGNHGIQSASVASASTNNNIGVAGLGWNTKLRLDFFSPGSITIAVRNGADVINFSWLMFPDLDLVMKDEVRDALSQGIVCVHAAGNGTDAYCKLNPPFLVYPSCWDFGSLGQVISVSLSTLDMDCIDYSKERWSDGNNYSPGTDPINDPTNAFIDFIAPGNWIDVASSTQWTTPPFQSTYAQFGGTSTAAPFVSALCALILSINDNLTPVQVYNILKNTADKINPGTNHPYNTNGWSPSSGYGRINAYKALKYTIENYGGTFDQDVILPAGDTWILQPGVTLKFNNNCSLIVNGTLNATGTASSKITFQRNGSSGTWGMIRFVGTGAANSVLNNVIINNANSVQCLNGANVTIQNSILNNCTNGIYVYNSEPLIKNNQINDIVNNGIYGEASFLSPEILHNKINNYSIRSGEGIYLYNSTMPYIAHNDISGLVDGIYIGNNSVSYFGDNNSNLYSPNNRLQNNMRGIVAGYGSWISCGSTSLNTCYNTFTNNLNYNAYSYENSLIYAQNNYWGDGLTSVYAADSSILITTWPLGSDPWLSGSSALNNKEVVNVTEGLSNIVIHPHSSEKGKDLIDIETGILLEKSGKVNEALDHYKKMVNNDNNTSVALLEIAKLMKKYSKEDINNYYDGLSINAKYKPLIINIKANILLLNGQFEPAITNFDKVINDYPDHNQSINSRFCKLFAYINYKNEIERADNILSEIKRMNLKDEEWLKRISVAEQLIEFAKHRTVFFDTNFHGKNNPQTLTNSNPVDFALLGNFPNPFNPSTTIQYSLPENSAVEVIIYNIMGEVINLFHMQSQEAGYHSVKWNGKTTNNEQAASGVYICKVRAKSEVGKIYDKSIKMLLMK